SIRGGHHLPRLIPFPYTTLFRSTTDGTTIAGNFIGTNAAGTAALPNGDTGVLIAQGARNNRIGTDGNGVADAAERNVISGNVRRSEEHTSELQSRVDLVCRLLLE